MIQRERRRVVRKAWRFVPVDPLQGGQESKEDAITHRLGCAGAFMRDIIAQRNRSTHKRCPRLGCRSGTLNRLEIGARSSWRRRT